MFSLVNVGHVLCDCGFSKHVEPFEDTLIGEVQVAVAVATVLLGGLLEGTLLGNMSLFMAVVAEAVVASALKKRALRWTTASQGQRHPIFSCCAYRSISNMDITYLF